LADGLIVVKEGNLGCTTSAGGGKFPS